MKTVAQILLRAFLRRYPLQLRINYFGYLSQYAWLKDLLEELRPELFPQPVHPEPEPELTPDQSAELERVLQTLKKTIVGRQGIYQVQQYVGRRGNGHLFVAVERQSQTPVAVKEFLLQPPQFNEQEAKTRQQLFTSLAGLNLADGRSPTFRVVPILEAIADTTSAERCYLISDIIAQEKTLKEYLQGCEKLESDRLRHWLIQLLQTLHCLHSQRFILPAGQVKSGVVHGNLTLDSILWVEHDGAAYLYLTDLYLWEHLFIPEKSPESPLIQADLAAVGNIGTELMSRYHLIDPELNATLQKLHAQGFQTAGQAHQALLKLAPLAPSALSSWEESEVALPPSGRSWHPLVVLAGVGLAASAAWTLAMRMPRATPALPPITTPTCCLNEVSAIPTGTFTYSAIADGTWQNLMQQRHPRSLASVLAQAQPKMQLQYRPANSLAAVMKQVQTGQADFAVMPLIPEWRQRLPVDLAAQEIAYDGLAVFVSFSYSKREQSLPSVLSGQLTLPQVKQLFQAELGDWRSIARSRLPVSLYLPTNPEAIAIFETLVLQRPDGFTNSQLTRLSTLPMLRGIIQDFEIDTIGSIGFTPLSELSGQCSIYPLALAKPDQPAVPSLAFQTGQAVDPSVDLCDRKGTYGPNTIAFQTGQYPLSYPLAVIYPSDNRRAKIGKKFAELLRTGEGQQLLREAGLVPLSPIASPRPAAPSRS